MKKLIIKTLAFALILLSAISMLTIISSATQARYYNFSTAYEYSSDPGTYMANIALAQKGKTGSNLGYSEPWCANFIGDCAALAGQSNAVPANASCPTFYDGIRNVGGTIVSSPKVGDIAFIDNTGGTTSRDHVELVYNVSGGVVYTIGGNCGRTGSSYTNYVNSHTPNTLGGNVVYYVRPNYSSPQPRSTYVNVWVSELGSGYQHYQCPEITSGTTQTRYYIWFKIFDSNTGDLYNSYEGGNYTSTVGIYYSDGSEKFVQAYSSSDSNWISVVLNRADTYRINITVSGDLIANYDRTFTVEYNASLNASNSNVNLDINGTNSSTITFTPTGGYPSNQDVSLSYDNTVISKTSGGWSDNSYTMTVRGLKVGTTSLKASLYENYTGTKKVVASAIVNVTVTGPSYTISYDVNGGTNAPASETKDYGNDLKLSMGIPSKTGYTFRGWAKSSGASSPSYYPYDIYSNNANLTLYAVWRPATTIFVGTTTVEPEYKGQKVYYKFTPTVGGTYTLTGIAKNATYYYNNYLYLNSSDGTTLARTNSTDTVTPASLTYTLTAGSKYYYSTYVGFPASGSTAPYNITLTRDSVATHTVTYNYTYNGGTSATKASASVSEGSVVDFTPTATKNGWVFVGWNTNGDATSALTSLTMGTGDVTLYAIYKKTLTGTFIDYSGTIKTTRTASATIYNKATSGTITAPAQNTYTGWTKRGWGTGTTANASVVSSYTISVDATFYGLYQRTLTLSYNANGGNTTPSSQTGLQYTNSYAVSTYSNPTFTLVNTISKAGATFSKWVAGSVSGTQYNAGASITITADTTMYAVWTNVNYTVTYNANGGSVSPSSTSVASGSATTLPTPTNSFTLSYNANNGSGAPTSQTALVTCKGWSTSSTATSASYSCGTSYSPAASVTLHAVWNTSAAVTASSTIPTRSGYTFLGWSTNSTATTASYTSGSSVNLTANIILYAVWQLNTTPHNTVTYNANGGSVSPSSASVASGSATTLPTPTKSFTLSYNANNGSGAPTSQTASVTCKGWSTSSTATTASYSCGASYTPTSSVTLFAVWNTSAAATASLTIPTRSGYTFLGWSTSSTATMASYTSGSSVNLTANTTLYAVWRYVPMADPTITVSPSTLKLDMSNNKTGYVTVMVDFSRSEDVKFVCRSSNAEIVSTAFGSYSNTTESIPLTVTATDSGSCVLTIELYNAVKSVLYDTENIEVEVSDISFKYISIRYNASTTLTFDDFVPVSYSSSNESVATVTPFGAITGVGTGTANILAMDADGNTRTTVVTVSYAWWQWLIKILFLGWFWY